MTDYVTFVNDTAAILLQQLPLQNLDSSVSLVTAYISNVGGWIPDNHLLPYGNGAPGNAFSEQQSADDITTIQYNACYDIEFHVVTTTKVQCTTKLTDGLSFSAAASSMINQISNFIKDAINNSPIPVQVLSTGAQTTTNSNSMQGGFTTQTIRNNIVTEIANVVTDKVVDYKAIALTYVQTVYGVDDTWNVYAIYVQADNPIVVSIKKYTDDTYASLDTDDTRVYVINISPVTYQVVAGVLID